MSLVRLQKALTAEIKKAEREVARLLARIAMEQAKGRTADEAHVLALAREIDRVCACADLSGRVYLRFGVTGAEPEAFADIPDLVPPVVFEEALRDLLERDPIGAASLETAGLEVASAYGSFEQGGREVFPHGFALAKAATVEVAAKVQEKLAQGLREGVPSRRLAKEIAETWSWPEDYARNVVRTNVNTATSAGRFREAARVHESGIPVGFRFSSVLDSDVRRGRAQDHGENHKALDGLVARVDDPIWRDWTPPLGYQCRCTLEPVVGDQVPKGWVNVPAGASKAPGFGTRPDIRTYGMEF